MIPAAGDFSLNSTKQSNAKFVLHSIGSWNRKRVDQRLIYVDNCCAKSIFASNACVELSVDVEIVSLISKERKKPVCASWIECLNFLQVTVYFADRIISRFDQHGTTTIVRSKPKINLFGRPLARCWIRFFVTDVHMRKNWTHQHRFVECCDESCFVEGLYGGSALFRTPTFSCKD